MFCRFSKLLTLLQKYLFYLTKNLSLSINDKHLTVINSWFKNILFLFQGQHSFFVSVVNPVLSVCLIFLKPYFFCTDCCRKKIFLCIKQLYCDGGFRSAQDFFTYVLQSNLHQRLEIYSFSFRTKKPNTQNQSELIMRLMLYSYLVMGIRDQ